MHNPRDIASEAKQSPSLVRHLEIASVSVAPLQCSEGARARDADGGGFVQ